MKTNLVAMGLALLLLAQPGRSLFGENFGPAYARFKAHPLALSEPDLHLLHDAFHINLHFTDQQATDLLSQIKDKISTAQGQSGQAGSLIANTQNLIQFVKEAKDAIANPGSLLKDTVSKFWSRALAGVGSGSPGEILAGLEGKVAEAKANQSTIDRSLQSANQFLGALETVKALFGGQQNAWQKVKGFFGFAAAHLEKLAEEPPALRGKRRLSLYQQEARRERLFNMADKVKKALNYLHSVPEDKLSVHDLEHHLYDLIEEEGTLGSVYLRFVDTLKCILLKTCPAGVAGVAGVAGQTTVITTTETQTGAGGANVEGGQPVSGEAQTTSQEVTSTDINGQENPTIGAIVNAGQEEQNQQTATIEQQNAEENVLPEAQTQQTGENVPSSEEQSQQVVVQEQTQPAPAKEENVTTTTTTTTTVSGENQPVSISGNKAVYSGIQNNEPVYSSYTAESQPNEFQEVSTEHPVSYFGQTQVVDSATGEVTQSGALVGGSDLGGSQTGQVFTPTSQSDIIVVNENDGSYLPPISDIPVVQTTLEQANAQAGNQ